MNIEVTCLEVGKYERKVEVYYLFFDLNSKAFSMFYCYGDNWNLELKCPLEIFPISFTFFRGTISVIFDRHNEAESFVDWLIEGEEKVQRGFETMRD